MTYICHTNNGLFTVCNSSTIVCFNATRQQATTALADRDLDDSILDTQAAPEVFWPTLLAAFNTDREAVLMENESLRGSVDALTDFVSDLSAEIEEGQSRRSLEIRIAEIQQILRDRIPAHRKYLSENTIPAFDVNVDSFVMSHLIQTTTLGKELTVLKGLLNG